MNTIAVLSLGLTKPRRSPSFPAHITDTVRSYVHAHLDEKVSSGMLAEHVQLSPSYFCQSFKATFGQTLTQYLRALRLERACQLMIGTEKTLIEIAHECGMADQSHLCRCFRERFGVPPSQWRRGVLVRANRVIDETRSERPALSGPHFLERSFRIG